MHTNNRKKRLSEFSGEIPRRSASLLHSIFKRMSLSGQKWFFFIVFIGIAVYCVALMTGKGTGIPEIGKMKSLRLQESAATKDLQTARKKVQDLWLYLDTLPPVERDSFLNRHPGILDSIRKWQDMLDNN